MIVQTATLSYPRIGKNREVKKALQLRAGVANFPRQQIWVNPDCGIKTRRWQEVIPSLKSRVRAAKLLWEKANAKAK